MMYTAIHHTRTVYISSSKKTCKLPFLIFPSSFPPFPLSHFPPLYPRQRRHPKTTAHYILYPSPSKSGRKRDLGNIFARGDGNVWQGKAKGIYICVCRSISFSLFQSLLPGKGLKKKKKKKKNKTYSLPGPLLRGFLFLILTYLPGKKFIYPLSLQKNSYIHI